MRFCNNLGRGFFKMSTSMEQIDWNHWLLRLVAFIIDSILVSIVVYIILFIAAVAAIVTGGFYAGFYFLFFWLIAGVLYIIYFTIFDVVFGGTIGKMVLGLKVQTVDGKKVPFDKSLIRNVSKFFGLVIIDWLVAILTPGKDRRQKWTDRIAGTTVVQTRQPFQSVTQPSPTPEPPPPPPPPA